MLKMIDHEQRIHSRIRWKRFTEGVECGIGFEGVAILIHASGFAIPGTQ